MPQHDPREIVEALREREAVLNEHVRAKAAAEEVGEPVPTEISAHVVATGQKATEVETEIKVLLTEVLTEGLTRPEGV